MLCACVVTSVLEFGITDHSFAIHYKAFEHGIHLQFDRNYSVLGVRWQDRGMGAEDAIVFELQNIVNHFIFACTLFRDFVI